MPPARPVTGRDTDYFYVYQGSSVGFTTAQLLANDSDPQNQTLTVVAVSEPSNNGTLTGTLTTGYTYTPGTDAALVGTDSQLNYLVTDTDGHVTQGTITIRILAADDTNTATRRRDDVARTNAGDADARVRARQRLRPRRRQLHWSRSPPPPTAPSSYTGIDIIYYTPTTGFSGVETITYTIRDNHGLTATGTVTVWVDTGAAAPPSHPTRTPTTSTSTKAPRSASPPPNSSPTTPTPKTRPSPSSPCPNPPTTAPSPAPSPPATPTPPARRRPRRHRQPTQLPRHRHRRPRHPRHHHHPHPRRRRHQPATRRP